MLFGDVCCTSCCLFFIPFPFSIWSFLSVPMSHLRRTVFCEWTPSLLCFTVLMLFGFLFTSRWPTLVCLCSSQLVSWTVVATSIAATKQFLFELISTIFALFRTSTLQLQKFSQCTVDWCKCWFLWEFDASDYCIVVGLIAKRCSVVSFSRSRWETWMTPGTSSLP